jgi:hypothetical protein
MAEHGVFHHPVPGERCICPAGTGTAFQKGKNIMSIIASELGSDATDLYADCSSGGHCPISQQDDGIDEVGALLDEYEQVLSGKGQRTTEAYLRTVRHLIAWVAQRPGNKGRFQPPQLTQTAVEDYLTHLEQEGLSLNHLARVKSTISNFALFLIEEKRLLQRNPTLGI